MPELGRSPGGGHSNPPQYSCLEDPMAWDAWQATVHGVQRVGHEYLSLCWTWVSFFLKKISVIEISLFKLASWKSLPYWILFYYRPQVIFWRLVSFIRGRGLCIWSALRHLFSHYGYMKWPQGSRISACLLVKILLLAWNWEPSVNRTTLKPLTVWGTTNCGKFSKRWKRQTTWPASWETHMQVKKQ